MLDQAALPWFAELNRSLSDPPSTMPAFRERIRASTRQMRALATEIVDRAEGRADGTVLRRILAEGARLGDDAREPTDRCCSRRRAERSLSLAADRDRVGAGAIESG